MSKSTYNVTRHEPSEKVIEHIIRLEQLQGYYDWQV